jgi:hypothetical protein
VKIETEYRPKPIPFRGFDWIAIDAGSFDGPGSPYGHGATEQEAIDELLEQLDLITPAAEAGEGSGT